MLGWIAKLITSTIVYVKNMILNTFIDMIPGIIYGIPTVF